MSSAEVAETTKIFENAFRNVNIALVNELKVILDTKGIDVWEVIRTAATKPFGFMPFYMTYKAHEYEILTRFIEYTIP